MCLMLLPSEQLSETSADSTVSLCAFANVTDTINGFLDLTAMSPQVTQAVHNDGFVTVVQHS